jgi:hypothetical protein
VYVAESGTTESRMNRAATSDVRGPRRRVCQHPSRYGLANSISDLVGRDVTAALPDDGGMLSRYWVLGVDYDLHMLNL